MADPPFRFIIRFPWNFVPPIPTYPSQFAMKLFMGRRFHFHSVFDVASEAFSEHLSPLSVVIWLFAVFSYWVFSLFSYIFFEIPLSLFFRLSVLRWVAVRIWWCLGIQRLMIVRLLRRIHLDDIYGYFFLGLFFDFRCFDYLFLLSWIALAIRIW